MRAPLATLVAAVMLSTFASASLAKDLTRCGQTVGKHEVGVLMNDLNCPSLPGSCESDDSIPCDVHAECPVLEHANPCRTGELLFEKTATLKLNGYTLTSSHPNISYRTGVNTLGMTIEGPGTIAAPGGIAVYLGHGKLVIKDVVLRDSFYGLYVNGKGTVEATNVSVLDNEGGGIAYPRKLTGSNVTVSGNGFNTGLPPGSVFGAGISAKTVRVDGLTAQNNVGPGVWADSVRLENATIDGNNGFQAGVDLATEKKPRLETSSCGVSARLSKMDEVIGSWDVCSGDCPRPTDRCRRRRGRPSRRRSPETWAAFRL